MSRLPMVIPIALMVFGGTACATKQFVRTSVGEVNEKVESLNKSLEQTQQQVRGNEGRIAEVDQKAQAAAQSAAEANTAAVAAGTTATAASTKVNAIDTASRRLVNEVMLSEDEGNFRFGDARLPDSARQKIDALIQQLKQDPKDVYFEIEGHTDSVGEKAYNDRLGLERATVVKEYLHEQYHIPLHKLNVISYGEDKPIASNNTRNGREQNRRVVVRVLN
jgi:peptidoglycan-associated lipoprotein